MQTIWLRALRQEHLDLTFRSGPATIARIVERPGTWMAPPELEALAAELRTIARRTLPSGDLAYGVVSDGPEALERSIITIVYDRDSRRPLAFNALVVMPVMLHGRREQVLHLGLVMIDPDARSQGFSWMLYGLTCLVLFVRNQFRPLWLSSVTQVPAAVGMVSETFSDVFPGADGGVRRSFNHLVLARQIMAHHRHVFGVGAEAGFDEEQFIIRNAYTGGSDHLKKTFADAPKHRDPRFNAFCARELDYARGDDVLQIGRIDLAAARRYLLDDVPRRSLPGVLGALAFVALQRGALPLVYWLSPGRPWGFSAHGPAEMTAPTPAFDYATFTNRNIGFVTPQEQATLRDATVFVAGTGGMGGACVMALARTGIGHLIVADIDRFEISNLNRQVFAFAATIDRPKAAATAEMLRAINPEMQVEVLGREWPSRLPAVAGKAQVMVNGTDDLAAALLLYRTGRAAGRPVIDAYTAPLPSVTVVRPGDPMPEERLGFPTCRKAWHAVRESDRRAALLAEFEYVLIHSSARRHIEPTVAAEVVTGRRSPMSFATMVIGTGMLMAHEVIALLLARRTGTDFRGWFLNPVKPAIERPRHRLVAALLRPAVRRLLARMAEVP